MSSIGEIRAAIEELDRTLGYRSPDEPSSPGIEQTRRSLMRFREELEEQLALAQRSELEVHLDGLPVVDHEIRVDALARFLARFQESVLSIAQALTGRVTTRAPLPASLRESAGLRLAAVFPGSFGATLRGPFEDVEEGLFEFDSEVSVLDIALKQVLGIMDLSSSDDGSGEDDIVSAVAPLGARTFGHLKSLSQLMSDEQLSAEFVWTPLGASSQYSRLTARGARRLNDVLALNEARERVSTLTGRLGTASEIRNRVELQLPDGEIVAARVVEELVSELRQYFGTSVRATFDVTTVVSATTGAERTTYVLTALASA